MPSVSKEVYRLLEQRRKKLEEELKGKGCPVEMPKILPYQLGNMEILAIDSVYTKSFPFYVVVTFKYKAPFTGEIGLMSTTFSGGIMIVPVTEEGYLLLKYEHRPSTGKWMWEFPRKFTSMVNKEREDPSETVEDVLRKEASSIFEEGELDKENVKLLREVYEDSGMRAAKTPIYLAPIKGLDSFQDKDSKKKIKWQLFSLSQILQQENLLQDIHCITALFSYLYGQAG